MNTHEIALYGFNLNHIQAQWEMYNNEGYDVKKSVRTVFSWKYFCFVHKIVMTNEPREMTNSEKKWMDFIENYIEKNGKSPLAHKEYSRLKNIKARENKLSEIKN